MKKIAIYGIGNFGFSLLKHLDKKCEPGVEIHAFDRNDDLLDHLRRSRRHLRFLRSFKISKNVVIERSARDLVIDADVLILAVNSTAVREVCRAIRPFISQGLIIVNTAKALDYKTGKRLSLVIREEMGASRHFPAMFSGGTIAADLLKSQPLGASIACEDSHALRLLTDLFRSENLFVYPSTDLVGVEYAAAFKNVIAILTGIIKGMGFSYGSQTHVISCAAHEIETFIVRELGGRRATFRMNSQCWSNDLWMSCTGNTRNREFGIMLGRGVPVEIAIRRMEKLRKTLEGLQTIYALKKQPDINSYPLIRFLYQFITRRAQLREIKEIIFNHEF